MRELKFEIKNKFNANESFNNLKINKKKRCFIVLGHEINKNNLELSESCKKRCKKLSEELNKQKDHDYILIFMGMGRSDLMGQSKYSLSEYMYNYFSKTFFIPEYSILDKNSMDTVGDAVFSSLILEKISFLGKLKVISSDWHIERVKRIFERIYDSNFKIDFIGSPELDYIKSNIKIKILRNERNSIEEFTNNFSGFNKERNSAFNYLIKNHKLYNNSLN